jgi:hypothetical protein
MQQAIHMSPSCRPILPVLPPITSSCSDAPRETLGLDRDKNIIDSLKQIVSKEFDSFQTHKDIYKKRYPAFKDAFSQLVQYLSGYQPLLTAVKAEFEDCVQIIERGQQEAFYLSGKVKRLVAEQTTLSYYVKRASVLEEM